MKLWMTLAAVFAVFMEGAGAAPPGHWAGPAGEKAPEGMETPVFKSFLTRGDVRCLVSLPEEYDSKAPQRYPVVYWLPGLGGGQRGALWFIDQTKKAEKSGAVLPMIIVGLDGSAAGWWCDSLDRRLLPESIVIQEIIPFIDRTYRTIPTRWGRGIEGFSVGGFGAAHLGLKYTETFSVVSSLGGPLIDAGFFAANAHDNNRKPFEEIFGKNRDYCAQNDPWHLARQNLALLRGRTALRIWVGSADSNAELTKKYHKYLDDLKLPHNFREVAGAGHNPAELCEPFAADNLAFFEKGFAAASKAETERMRALAAALQAAKSREKAAEK